MPRNYPGIHVGYRRERLNVWRRARHFGTDLAGSMAVRLNTQQSLELVAEIAAGLTRRQS